MYRYEMMLAKQFEEWIKNYNLPCTIKVVDKNVDLNLHKIIDNLKELQTIEKIIDYDEDLKVIRHNVYEAIDNIFEITAHSNYIESYAGLFTAIITLADELFLEPIS